MQHYFNGCTRSMASTGHHQLVQFVAEQPHSVSIQRQPCRLNHWWSATRVGLWTYLFLLNATHVLQLTKRHSYLHMHTLMTDLWFLSASWDHQPTRQYLPASMICLLAMRTNRLQLNPSNTEVLWCSSPRRQHQVSTRPFCTVSSTISPVSPVHYLSVHIDMTAISPWRLTSSQPYNHALQHRMRWRSITPQALLTLVCALMVHSKVDGVSPHHIF